MKIRVRRRAIARYEEWGGRKRNGKRFTYIYGLEFYDMLYTHTHTILQLASSSLIQWSLSFYRGSVLRLEWFSGECYLVIHKSQLNIIENVHIV